MNIGELNKGAIALILVLLVGAGGYLWYSMLYKPAVAKQTAAIAAEKTAQDGLADAKSRLAAAETQLQENKKANSASDDSVARLQLARKAVPEKKLIDDAAIVLMDLARRADVRTQFKAGGDAADAAVATPTGGNLSGATPIDLTFKAAGSYREMMLFMSYVEDTVAAEDGKIHARDRLFNVVKLEIGTETEAESGNGFSEGLEEDPDPNKLVARRGEMLFTVTVRMYTSSTQNAADLGTQTPDPAAAPTADGTGATGTGAQTTTDPAAGGATTTTDPAAGGATTTTDPAAGGATTTTDPAAGGGATPSSGTPTDTGAATNAAGGGVS